MARTPANWFSAAALAALLVFPALAQEAAPMKIRAGLKIEDLGAPIMRREVQGMYVYPDAQGVHHVLFAVVAFNGFENDPPAQFVDFNLQTGAVRASQVAGINCIGAVWAHPSGKLYIAGTRPSSLVEYDPATNALRMVGKLTPNFYHAPQSSELGPDGALYFGHYCRHVTRYDPKTGKLEDFGAMDGDGGGYVYSIAADGRYVYCGMSDTGKWYLVVYDRETGKQEAFRDLKGNVRRDAAGNIWFENVLLKDGKPVPADKVEEAKKTAVKPAANAVMGLTVAEKALGLEFDVSDVDPTTWNNGRIGLKWRKQGAAEWASAVFEGVQVVSNAPEIMAATEDGKLIGMGGHYGPIFIFDPETKKSDLVGLSPLSIGAILGLRHEVHFVGYSAAWYIWDRTKPWSMRGKGLGYAEGAAPNPVNISGHGKWPDRVVMAFDGCIYSTGNHGRHMVGGDAGWHDPKTKARGSYRAELEAYNVRDLCALEGGKLIVWSARSREGKAAALFVVDAATRQIARKIEFEIETGDPGAIMPAGKSAVLGLINAPRKDEKSGVTTPEMLLYKLDVESGKVVWQKRAPGFPFTGPPGGGATRQFALGPDGCGWLLVGNDVARVRPDGEIEKALALPHGARLVWLGNDLYLYGGGRQWYGGFASIWRIKDVFEK